MDYTQVYLEKVEQQLLHLCKELNEFYKNYQGKIKFQLSDAKTSIQCDKSAWYQRELLDINAMCKKQGMIFYLMYNHPNPNKVKLIIHLKNK